ncbi:MAG: ACT domain-containing protein [Verrucomicrobia bacterium]|nr:ACT domain-containing protein [Verrucomicrobiota bacterium]
MKKVLIPTKLDRIAASILAESGRYTVVQDDSAAIEALAKEHADTYALIVRSEKVTPEIIDALPDLKVVIRAGAGYNTIDTKYARQKGIDVMNTPGANANAVAEEVVALMLADARHVVPADVSTRGGKWEKKNFMGKEITGKTIGILGLGAIGQMVARRLEGFEMNVLGYDPMVSAERARDLGIEMVDVEQLFAQSDYISLHLPENDETRGMINAGLLGLMKPGATIVNCARAGVVNETDLRAAKAEKKLHYLNDVYPKDEAGDKPIADIADIMLPHLGASTVEANENAARRAAQQLIEFDEKGITSYIVNRDIPAGLDEAYADLAFTLTRLCRQAAGREGQLKVVETSVYGSLKPYSQWLLVPVTAALSDDFDRSMDHNAAQDFLKTLGVDYEDRVTDERKGFENSITVDLTTSIGGGRLREASVRGTVAEGNLMISRINDFDKLYFEPRGHIVIFTYDDRPGVLGRIGAALAEAGVNIDDVRNPHDSKGRQSLAMLRVNQEVPGSVIDDISKEIEADLGFCVEL